ncbi:MAG: DEAD/DEAH box helicase, partial [Chloroflexota bacterium]
LADVGYETPSPIQAACIPQLLAGRDLLGEAQTGTGKTAAFALPILQNLQKDQGHVQALVLAPTRELALQVANAMYEYGQHLGVRVLAVYGGSSYSRQITRLKKGVDVVVGTPGRLLDLIERGVLDLGRVQTIVLDEADEMLSMGFVEDIESILKETPAERQTALFSATLPTPIRRLADKYMREPQSVTIQREQVTVAAIEQRYYLVNDWDKLAALTRLFEVEPITSALIFARTRAGTGELANELTRRGFPAETLNGDLSQELRERVLNRFRQNQVKVLVATDVAARGLDIDDISHVINFDLPEDPEVYVHRIGRTGRAGKTGIAISLVPPREQFRLRKIEQFTRHKLTRASLPTVEDITQFREGQLLEQVSVWLQRARYKREREMVEALMAEGHDPADIAAAALKIARAEEKQRPIAELSEVLERPERRERRQPREGSMGPRRPGSRAARGSESHEEGMVRLSLSIGKSHGIRPADIVGSIAFHADIPGHTIGKIYIQDHFTLVDVPAGSVGRVLAKNGGYSIRRQPFVVEKA